MTKAKKPEKAAPKPLADVKHEHIEAWAGLPAGTLTPLEQCEMDAPETMCLYLKYGREGLWAGLETVKWLSGESKPSPAVPGCPDLTYDQLKAAGMDAGLADACAAHGVPPCEAFRIVVRHGPNAAAAMMDVLTWWDSVHGAPEKPEDPPADPEKEPAETAD
jgi:hypothetical protein